MLKIISASNPVLSQSAKRISKIDSKILKFIGEMEKALLSAKDPVGVGLAASQVGRSLQIFITKPTSKSKISVFINPEIMSKGLAKEEGFPTARTDAKKEHWREGLLLTGPRISETGPVKKENESTKLEGCLSLPNIWGEVKREPKIKLQYQLITNNHELITKTGTFSGFMATIIQHEMDHLQGVLFPKRVLEQKGTLYKSHKDEKGEDIFEEITI